jgi:hypothetical protein
MADDHLIPNTTQVPNSILDLLMPFLNDGEARVLLYLCRRIYGFQRESDSISLDQFVHGIRHETGNLDFGAGVSRRGAMNALVILKEIGIVEQLDGGQGRSRIPVFGINRKCEMMQWLHLISQTPDKANELIVQRLHLLREKHALTAPFTRKPKKDKVSAEKVQDVHLKEKVQVTTIKGASKNSENRASKGLDAHTKPSIQNQVKDKDKDPTPTPPKKRSGRVSGVKGMRLPKDWTPTEADEAWAKKKGYHTLLNLEETAEEFCRYWWSRARDNTKLDWSMTWQNRVQELANRELDRRQKGTTPAPTPYKFN